MAKKARKGLKRTGPEKVSTTVRLPEDVRRRSKIHAAELGITLEAYVTRALILYHQQQEAVA
jgi:predicted HicB family RNase H-like nuclease